MVQFHTSTESLGWLKSRAVVAVIALSSGVFYSHAMAASPTEVNLASPAQALKYCQGGTQKGVAYFTGNPVYAQYPGRKCSQAVPQKTMTKALVVSGDTVFECKLATAQQAVTLCHHRGLGKWDIAYIKGPASTAVFGPGYGCTTGTSTPSIGAAICK